MNSIKIIRGNDTELKIRLRKNMGDGTTVPCDLTHAQRLRVALTGLGSHVFLKDVESNGDQVSGVIPGRTLALGAYNLEITFTLGGRDRRFVAKGIFEGVDAIKGGVTTNAEGICDGVNISLTVTPDVIEIANFSGDYEDLNNRPDLSEFITRLVDDLANYYLKSETYTKEEVAALLAAIKQFRYESVTALPTASAGTMCKIYLIPSSDPQAGNIKDEYITIRSGEEGGYSYSWEQIGSTAIDLDGYYRHHLATSSPSEVANPMEGDICHVSDAEESVKSNITTGYNSIDLTPYSDYKIMLTRAGTLYNGDIVVTKADTTTETLNTATDLPKTYDAGVVTEVRSSSTSVMMYSLGVYRLYPADYEYVNGAWERRGESLKFSQQTLPDEQKRQARANIGAAESAGTQSYFTENVEPMQAKEGDIIYLNSIVYEENLQNKENLGNIPIVQGSLLRITNRNFSSFGNVGKITITGSYPGWGANTLGTIEVVNVSGYNRMAVIDNSGVQHIINYYESYALGTSFKYMGFYDVMCSNIAISETLEEGQESLLRYVKIDDMRELSIKELRNGNWIDRKNFPSSFDDTPTVGSGNLVKSGAIAEALAGKAQSFLTNAADTPPDSPKEGDVWDRPAYSGPCPGQFVGGVDYVYTPNANLPVTIPLADGATSISLTVTKTDSTQETLTDISEFPKTYPAGEVASFPVVTGLGNPTQDLPAAKLRYHNDAWMGIDAVLAEIAGKQGIYSVPTSQIPNPKEGDITVIPEQVMVSDLQDSPSLTDISLNGGTHLKIQANSDAYQANLSSGGKINILGLLYRLYSGSVGSIEVRNVGGLLYLYAVDKDGVANMVSGRVYNLPAKFNYTYGSITGDRISLMEVIGTGEHSILPYIKIDSVIPEQRFIYHNGNWVDIDKMFAAIDTVEVTVGNNTGTPQGSGSVAGNVLKLYLDNIKGPAGESAIRARIDYTANENNQAGLAWDTVHVWPEISGLASTLAPVPNDGLEHHIILVFDTPADASQFVLDLPNVLWGSDINLASVITGYSSCRIEVEISSASMIALFTKASLPSNS